MQANHVLAIDQGTTGTTVMILNKNLVVKAKVNQEFKQHYPKPGWVEHDANEIWQSTTAVIGKALKQGGLSGKDIAAIGITNQRETTVLWDKKTSKPIHKAIVWQDRRTASVCASLRKQKGVEAFVKKNTGLVLDPYFSGTKIKWILDNAKPAKNLLKKNQLAFGTIDSWLVWQLTGGKVHVTDVTNASRTLLMNLKTLKWDEKLLKIFGVPKNVLPEIKSCSEIYGTTKSIKGLPDGIPIAGMAGDQQAALFGQACFEAGEAKCTYGTGSFLLMNVGDKPSYSKSGLLTTVAWQLNGKTAYALEGSAFIAGAAVQWLRDELQFIKSSPEIEKLAKTVKDNGGVTFVPSLVGLGAPHWDPNARGVLSGLTRGSNRGHVARAVLEGIALSQFDILEAMQKDSKKKLKKLKVDGGASANNLLMQFQADVLQCQIVRPKIVETTAMGAAFLAGLAVGVWKSQSEIRKVFKVDKTFSQKMKTAARAEIVSQWRFAVKRAQVHE